MVTEFLKLIEKYNKIIIFRHIDGDGDALGSQWGLYYYLKDKYPNKEVFVVGDVSDGYKDLFEAPHTLDDSEFSNALAIILDSANRERISDQRFKLCQESIKIDHHVLVDSYGDLEIVDETISSCGELLASILFEIEEDSILAYDVAKNLYIAMASDTINFTISAVNAKTFEIASKLLKSNINVSEIYMLLNEIDVNLFKFKAYLLSNITFTNNVAFIKISQKDLAEYKINISTAKRFVNLMREIKGINIWYLILQQKEDEDLYSVSLRTHNIVINDIAQKYGGGGHKFASGIKNLTNTDLDNLLNDLLKKENLG